MAFSMRGAMADDDCSLGVPYTPYAREYVQLCYISEQRMINQDAYIMRGSYIDEQGHTFKVQLPLEEMWAFHSQDKHTKLLLAAINFDGYFELPPWGYDIQRAHQVLFNYNDSYQTTSVMDLQGKMVQFKLDSQLVRKALGLHPCQKQFMGSNLRAEDKKDCFHPNSKNFTFSDIVIEDIKLAVELMMQHFHFAIPNRFTKPRIQFVRTLSDAHRKMSEKMDFAPWILRELLASRTYNPARGRYLAAVPALTRIAYLGIGAISQLPEPLRIIKGIPKSVRAVRGIAQKCRQSFGDSSDEEQTGDFNEHDPSVYDEEQGKEDRSLAQRMKKISNLIQETNMCPEDDANRTSRHKLAEEQEDTGFQERSPPVENQRQMCKEIDTNKTDLFLKELLPSDECAPIWDNKMKEPASMQVTIPRDTVIESRISVNGQYEESEKECGNDVGDYEEQSNALLVLIEADKERATDVIETRLLQTGSVTQDRSEKNVHKRKLAEAELEEPFCVGKAIKGDVVNVEHARKDRESGSNMNELPAPQAKAISSQQSPISIAKEEMKKKIEELKATAIQFACVQTIEEQKEEFPEDGQLNEKHRNSAVIQIAMQAMDAIEDLDVHGQVTCFSDEYMTSMYNNLYIQLMKTQTVEKMREAALMKHLDLLSELLYDSVEQMDVKNRRIHELEAELVKLRNHQLDLQVKATQMEVHLLQSLNLERVMSIKEHLVEEKNNEIRRLSDRLQECELQLIQAEKVARDAIEDAKIAQSKLQEERQLHLQTMRPQVLGQDADPIASFNGKELQRLQYQLQRAEKLREQQEKDMSELYLQNTQLQTTLADLQNEIQSLKFNVVVLSPGKNQASSANKNCKCYFPTSCSIIENRGKAPIAAMSFLSQSIRPTSQLELEGNKPALTCTVSEQLCVDGEGSVSLGTLQNVQQAPKADVENICLMQHLVKPESVQQYHVLNLCMMRAYVASITGAWANQHPNVVRGGFNTVDPLNWQTKDVMFVQPEWRKAWLQKYPHTIHIYAKAPRAVRTDPNYCPVQRRSTWKAHEEKLKSNPNALNYPVLPDPEHGEDLNEEWFLRTCDQQISIFKDANDVACLMLCKILDMMQTCIYTFKDIEKYAALHRFDHPTAGLAFRFSSAPSEEQLHGYFARLQYLPSQYMNTFEEAMTTEFFHGGYSSVFASNQNNLESRYLAHQERSCALTIPSRAIRCQQNITLHGFRRAVRLAARCRKVRYQSRTSLRINNFKSISKPVCRMKGKNLVKGCVNTRYMQKRP